MQSKLVLPGGNYACRGIAAVRVRPRCAAPRAGAEFYPGESDDQIFAESSSVADATSSQTLGAGDSADFNVVANRLEHSVADQVTEDMRNCSEDDFRPSPPASSFDPLPLGSTLISGPMVAVRHKVMDSAAAAHEVPPPETSASTASLEVVEASQAGSMISDEVQLVSTVDTPQAISVTIKSTPEQAAPVATSLTIQSTPEVATPVATSLTIKSTPELAAPVATSLTIQSTPEMAEPVATSLTTKSNSELAAPVATSATQHAAVDSAPSTPVRVRSVSDTFTTGGEPSPGNRDSFITGKPSPGNTSSPRPYMASNPSTDSRGYPAFKFDEAAASQYSSAAQSIPTRPNYESRYPSRSSNCDSPPPPLADALSSSRSIGMPSDTYGYRRLPQEAVPGYGYNRASGSPQQAPQRPYQYRVPPDYGPAGGSLPLAPPSGRGLPPQGYGTPNDPWDIFESGSAIGQSQGLLHIDGGVYGGGGGGGGYGGYSNSAPSYGGPSSSYGYGGGGGYSAPAPPPPPPPPSYQYGGYGNGGGGGGYGQQSQYYAPPPPSQYGGGASQGGGYRGAPPPQADPGQFYGGGYSAPAAPRRAAPPPQPQPDYTYKARAPAGNLPEENLSSYAYGNSYNGGSGFGGGGNFGGQTSYGSPVPGNYPGGGQAEEGSYPGIELLSPGYPEYERHARQSGGGGSSSRSSGGGELRYPGLDGGSGNMQQQQRTVAPSGITEYSDRMTPPAYGSSYSGFTAPSAYEVPPPDAYAQYQQAPPGGYYAPPPAPPPDAQYGYRGYAGAGGGYAGPAQGYPQRPMGLSQEEGGPIAARQPRIMVSQEMPQGDQLVQIRGDVGTASHGIVETVLPFAALPEASNVAMLAAANAPGPQPSLHFGVLAAALCCIIAASAGVTMPKTGARK